MIKTKVMWLLASDLLETTPTSLQNHIKILVKVFIEMHTWAFKKEKTKGTRKKNFEKWKLDARVKMNSAHFISCCYSNSGAWDILLTWSRRCNLELPKSDLEVFCDNCRKSAPSVGCSLSGSLTRNIRTKRKLSLINFWKIWEISKNTQN